MRAGRADFFISYSEADRADAAWIAQTLTDAGYSVRFAGWELSPADDIEQWMQDALNASDRLIGVCSPTWRKGSYSRREFNAFSWEDHKAVERGHGGTCILVVVKPTEFERAIRHFKRIELFGLEEAAARTRLLSELRPAVTYANAPREPQAVERAPPDFPAQRAATGRAAAVAAPATGAPSALLLFLVCVLGLIAAPTENMTIWRADAAAFLSEHSVLVMLALAVLALISLFRIAINHAEDRRALINALRLDAGGRLYRTSVNRLLDRLDGLLASAADRAPSSPFSLSAAWSPGLLTAALLAALTYPIASAYGLWALTYEPQYLGEMLLLPAVTITDASSRFALFTPGVAIVCYAASLVLAYRVRQCFQEYLDGAPLWPAILWLGLAVFCFNLSIRIPFTFESAQLFKAGMLGELQIAVTSISLLPLCAVAVGVSYSAFAAALLLGVVIALGVALPELAPAAQNAKLALSVLAAATLALLLWYATASIWNRDVRRWFGGLTKLALIMAVVPFCVGSSFTAMEIHLLGIEERGQIFGEDLFVGCILLLIFLFATGVFARVFEYGPLRWGGRLYWYLGFVLAFAAIRYAALIIQDTSADQSRQFLIAILGVFPLINCLFDFVSIGMTRYFMRAGARNDRRGTFLRPLLFGIIDVLTALLIMAGLIAVCILVFTWLRDGAGNLIIDIDRILFDIRNNLTGEAGDAAKGYWWLYISFFSTLAPSLLHLSIAFFSLVAVGPTSVRRILADSLERVGGARASDRVAALALPVMGAIAVLAPVFGLWLVVGALFAGGEDIGLAFLEVAERIAELASTPAMAAP